VADDEDLTSGAHAKRSVGGLGPECAADRASRWGSNRVLGGGSDLAGNGWHQFCDRRYVAATRTIWCGGRFCESARSSPVLLTGAGPLPGKLPVKGLPGAKRRDATAGSDLDRELSRRHDARRGRTARPLLQARPPRVRNGGDRQAADAGLTALRQRPAPVRGSAKGSGPSCRPRAARLPRDPSRQRRALSTVHAFPGDPRVHA